MHGAGRSDGLGSLKNATQSTLYGTFKGDPGPGHPDFMRRKMNPQSEGQKLIDLLSEQRIHGHVDLNDKYIGDGGATILANFLRENTHIKTLLLRGNKISSAGFAQICSALSLNSSLTKLSAEWNDIGLDSRGITALYEWARSSNTLRTLDLRNNAINGLEAEPLARLIHENSSLNTINLSFNDLGNQGGNMILDALRHNKNIFQMNVAGNSISEPIVNDIDNCLRANSKLVNVPTDAGHAPGFLHQTAEIRRGLGLGPNDNLTRRRQPAPEPIIRDEGTRIRSGVKNLNPHGIPFTEAILNEERRRGIETREVMAKRIDELMKKDLEGAHIIRELETKYYEAQEAIENQKRENEKLREDYMKSRDEVNLLELRYEEKVKNLEFQLIEREKEEKLLMDKILTEHNVNVKELNAEWGGRLEEAEKKYRTAMNTKEDLEIELQRVLDSVNIVKQEHSLELKELIERIKDEEYNKYEEKLLSLTARLSALEQAREEHSRKLAADFNEGQHREKKLQDNLLGLEADNNKLISENMSLKNHNEELRQTNDRLKAEIVAKDIKISNLDRENIELHQILNNKKEHHSQEVDNLLREHKQERISWDNLREDQHHKIQELERLLRLNEMEIQKMRQDYQKLADILQTNVTKVIYQTFVDTN